MYSVVVRKNRAWCVTTIYQTFPQSSEKTKIQLFCKILKLFHSNLKQYQGGHGTGKTGNLVLTFSRQGKHREFCFDTGKNFETQGKYFSVTQGKIQTQGKYLTVIIKIKNMGFFYLKIF